MAIKLEGRRLKNLRFAEDITVNKRFSRRPIGSAIGSVPGK